MHVRLTVICPHLGVSEGTAFNLIYPILQGAYVVQVVSSLDRLAENGVVLNSSLNSCPVFLDLPNSSEAVPSDFPWETPQPAKCPNFQDRCANEYSNGSQGINHGINPNYDRLHSRILVTSADKEMLDVRHPK